MKNALTLLFLTIFSLTQIGLLAQNSKDIILSIDNEDVTLEDFENIFRKNNRDTVVTKESLDEYIELFINFKLKVAEAKSLGMDTISDFIKELDGYRAQLARPYLTDSDLLDDLVVEAYNRKTEEVRASHILIKCDANASPLDTLRAYNRTVLLRDRILAGEDFAAVAKSKDGSEDPSAKQNGGDLGFFTVFQMVYPFESAAYNTQIGEISMPVRTRYGFHIITVTDKRSALGELHASHIMIRSSKKDSTDDKLKAEQTIRDIYDQLSKGADFAELAAKFSQDASTAKRGGELPWFGTGKMVEEFENIAFSLAEDGAISEPFTTDYGWHVVKRLEYRPVASLGDSKKELKSRVSRDSRSELTRDSFIEKLKIEYGLTVNEKCYNKIFVDQLSDSIQVGQHFVKKPKLLSKVLLSMDGQTYPAKHFLTHIEKYRGKGKERDKSNEEILQQLRESYLEKTLLKYEDSRLEDKHNAFRLLMNEYRDGILLFELTDEKVWSKAVKDTVGLEIYYTENADKFMWEERIDAILYSCIDESVATEARSMLDNGKSQKEIEEKINAESQLNVRVESDVYLREDKEFFTAMVWKLGITDDVSHNGQIIIAQISKVLAPEPKQLAEARGLVTAEYQNYLEAVWIEELRAKYAFEVKNDVLYSLIDG